MGRISVAIVVLLLLLDFGLAVADAAPRPDQPHTPGVGSPERRALVNAMRGHVERELGPKIIFIVERLSVAGDWCFARVVPRRPNGKAVDFAKTKYREATHSRALDVTGEALLKKTDGGWSLVEWHFSGTDSALGVWGQQYGLPAALTQSATGAEALPSPLLTAAQPAASSQESDASIAQAGANEQPVKQGVTFTPAPTPLSTAAESAPSPQVPNGSVSQATASEDPAKQGELAQQYFNGTGVPKDRVKAMVLAEKAAAGGDAVGELILGNAYNAGLGGGAESSSHSIEWWMKAAAQGNAEAEWRLASAYGSGKSIERNEGEFFRWSERAAEHGYAQAQAVLAGAFLQGEGVKIDLARGFALAQKSAAQGNSAGQYFLALALYNGSAPGGKDAARAFPLFLKLAQENDSAAQWMVAQAYANGDGVGKNRGEAVRWARQAAEQGYPDAEAFLGIAYSTGDGVPKDRGEAITWLTKAAAAGNENAKPYLAKLSAGSAGDQAQDTASARNDGLGVISPAPAAVSDSLDSSRPATSSEPPPPEEGPTPTSPMSVAQISPAMPSSPSVENSPPPPEESPPASMSPTPVAQVPPAAPSPTPAEEFSTASMSPVPVAQVPPAAESPPPAAQSPPDQSAYPPAHFVKNGAEIQASGDEFKLEQWSRSHGGLHGRPAYETWLISKAGEAVRLPEVPIPKVPGKADTQTDSGAIGFRSDFNFSPDNKYLLRVQKIRPGAGLAYLYRHVEGLNYEPLVRDLHLRASASFTRATKILSNHGSVAVEFFSWEPDDSLVLTLHGTRVWGWRCRFSPETGEFAEFTKSNPLATTQVRKKRRDR